MIGVDKPLGLTSHQCVERLRAADPSLRDLRLGHAGRLDPMAEGLLVVLVGDETRDVARHRAHDKTYELEVLLGVATDSFDSLGLVTAVTPSQPPDDDALARACAAWRGPVTQRYPPYAQARVGGRSLLAWGPAGHAMERPAASRVVHALTVTARGARPGDEVAAEATRRCGLVRGDFRQGAIAARWQAYASALRAAPLPTVTLEVRCSAGTYMRALAHDLGAALGAPALAWRIRRTAAGPLRLEDARALAAPEG